MASESHGPWRIVLLTDGGREIAEGFQQIIPALGHKIAGILTSPGPAGRGLGRYLEAVAAARPGVDVIVSNHRTRWAGMLSALEPDVIISMIFPWVIPDDVIALPRLAAMNVHGGLLPRGRGPNPLGWAFRNGDGEAGLTAHYLNAGLDTGPMLAQAAVPLGDDDTMQTLFPRFASVVPGLLAEAFTRIAAGDPGDVQDESLATYAGVFEEDYRAIDWSRTAREVHNQVRAWMAGLRGMTPGAMGAIDGQAVRVLASRIVSEEGSDVVPGTVVARDEDGPTVQCGSGRIKVLRSEPVDL